MCSFLSAIYLRTGKLICQPEFTDSHHELMEANGVAERDTTAPVQQFVKLELVPSPPPANNVPFDESLYLSFDKWHEVVDEHEVPAWFDAAARFDAFTALRDLLAAAANREGARLFGGLVFVKSAETVTHGSRVKAMSGSQVKARSGSRVEAWSGSQVKARSGSQVEARSGSRVEAWSGSQVKARSGSQVKARSGSRVEAMSGSRVEAWSGSQVKAWSGSQVKAWSGSNVLARSGSHVEYIKD